MTRPPRTSPLSPTPPLSRSPARPPPPAPPPRTRTPAGPATGGIADVTAKEPGKPTLAEVADFAGHNRVSINVMWTLFTGFLVLFMQAGFAVVGTGLSPAEDVAPTSRSSFTSC